MSRTSDGPGRSFGILSPLGFSAAVIAFVTFFILANRGIGLFCTPRPNLDCPEYWPISIVSVRAPPDLYYPQASHFIVALASIAVLCLSLVLLKEFRFNIALVSAVGLVLILGSNLIQGTNFGFVRPIRGPDEYFTDSQRIEDPLEFVATFAERQPEFKMHTRSHPPGAALAIWALSVILHDPAKVSVAIAALGVLLTAPYFHRLVSMEYDEQFSSAITLILLLTPSLQIYFAASVDAIIASVLLAGLACFIRPRSRASLILSFIFVSLASFMSFAFLFILPVIVGYEWLSTRTIRRSGLLIILLVLQYLIIDAATGFNYAKSFMVASSLENPQGYRLFSEPLGFLLTRMEDVAEIVLFFGPMLTPLAYLGIIRPKRDNHLGRVAKLGLGSLGLMLLSGAFKTGETARAAMFIYPYLMFLVARALDERRPSEKQWFALASVVFVQGVIMQLVGNYFW